MLQRGFDYEFFANEKAFYNIAAFFEEKKLAVKPDFVIMEEEICCNITIGGQQVKLFARPDRIEFYKDEIIIIDYKTQSPGRITNKQATNGEKPQLLFEALIISKLYPNFKAKIKLLYYFMDIADFNKTVSPKEITDWNLELMENSLSELLLNLETFFWREEGSFPLSPYKFLANTNGFGS
jgi:hypothetical protein